MFNISDKVITRNYKKARIICTDYKGIYPIIALINYGDHEVAFYYHENGKILKDADSEYDLIKVSEIQRKLKEKHELERDMDRFMGLLLNSNHTIEQCRKIFLGTYKGKEQYFDQYIDEGHE